MVFYYCVIIALIIKTSVLVLSITVERSRSGDLFDAPCNSCHLYNAVCADGSIHIFSCCNKCACESGATLYGDMCYGNLPQDQLRCEIFVEKDEFYGLKTHGISKTDVTSIGYIKDKWYWNRQVFNKCTIDDQSSYWDTKRWRKLFSDGRSISDFHFNGSNEGVMLKVFWFADDKWQLYIGLLMKLSITCYSNKPIPHIGKVNKATSDVSIQNGHYSLKSCLVIKIAGKRTYVTTATTATTPIPITRKPSTVKLKTALPKTTDSKTIVNVTAQVKISGTSTDVKTISSTSATIIPKAYTKGLSYETLCTIVIPAICMVLIIITCLFCVCCRRRNGSVLSGDKTDFVASYGSTDSIDSGSLLNSNEYVIINTPTYSDIWELENWEKTRKKVGCNNYPEKTTPNFWKDECTPPATMIAQETYREREPSETWDGTLYMKTDNMFTS